MAMNSPPDAALCRVSRKQTARPSVCVCVCVWDCGRPRRLVWRGEVGRWRGEAWKRGRRRHQRRGEIGSPRSDKAGCGARRQRKRDPPRDRERHACLPCLAPFSFSLIQLYRTPAPRRALGPKLKFLSLIERVCCGLSVCVLCGWVTSRKSAVGGFALFVVMSPTMLGVVRGFKKMTLFYSIITINRRAKGHTAEKSPNKTG